LSFHILLPLIQTVLSLILIPVVIGRHLQSAVHRLFSVYLFILTLYGGFLFAMRASPNLEQALFWEKALFPLAPLLAVVFYYFAANLTGIRIKKWLLFSVCGSCIFFLLISRTDLLIREMRVVPFGYSAVGGPLFPVVVLLVYTMMIMAFLNLLRKFRTSRDTNEKTRLLYITIGLSASLLGGIFDALLVMGLSSYPGAIIGNIIFCLLTTVAIIKHQLLDIRIVLRKSLTYLLVSLIIAVPYVGILYIVQFTLQTTVEPLWMHVVIILFFAIILRPLYSWAQQFIDRRFYRDRYDSLKALQQFTREAQSIQDSGELGSAMVNLLASALHTRDVHLLQPLPPDDGFHLAYSTSQDNATRKIVLKKRSPLLKWLNHADGALLYHELDLVPQLQGTTGKEREILESIGAELIVPIKTPRGQLSGVLILGQKLSEQPYNAEDMQLVYTISNHMSVNLENMHLYSDALQARESLEVWLNSMSDCIVIVNADQTIQFMNHAAERVFGESTGGLCWEVLGREKLCPICPLRYGIDNNVNRIQHVETIEGREFEVLVAPLLNSDGSISSIEVLRDITERRQAEERIREVEMMKELDQFRAELLANVSHELRTPLASIKGFSTLLLDYDKRIKRDERRQYLGTIDRATDRLLELVNQLLDMSRLEARRLSITKVPTSIRKLVREAAAEAQVSFPKHQFVLKLAKGLPRVDIDATRIRQVLDNLLSNAIKYSEEGTEVVISVRRAEDELLVSVADQGIGIPADQLSRVFERMFRVEQAPASRARGAGLGLSIAKGLVELQGGRIWVESEEGKGTTSYFTLPVYAKMGDSHDERA